MATQVSGILSLPPEIRQEVFKNLKEKGGIENIKAVAQTCSMFRTDIKELNLTLKDLRSLYQTTQAACLAFRDPEKICIGGWEGGGAFSRHARISYVAQILGGNQSSESIDKAHIASHILPLFHWTPVTPHDLTDPNASLNENKTFRRVENPIWEEVFFDGNQDQRSLEQCGLIPGHNYVYNYRLM